MERRAGPGSLGHTGFDGAAYQARFDALAASGTEVHGEADLVTRRRPTSVLDVGCGTGRVAIELARRGIEVVGVDVDASMLAVARDRGPGVAWIEADVTGVDDGRPFDLGRTFDLVLMAGNVPLFTPPGTEPVLVARCAAHVRPDGLLVAGFQLGRGYTIDDYDAHCAAAGLRLEDRFATWDEGPFVAGGDYAVSVHRRAPGEAPPT